LKVCVSSTANSLEGQVDPRFGRCNYLLIIDTQTMQYESIPNMACGSTGGAGIQAAQTMVDKGVKVVVTGNVGPNAFRALSTASIEIITGALGTVRDVVEKFKNGELSRTKSPTVEEHFGTRKG